MGVLGAEVFDREKKKWFRVKTQDHAQEFFRVIATKSDLHKAIPNDGTYHAWLSWLLEGHYAYRDICPEGIECFVVHRNCDIGHTGTSRGFGVVSVGAHGFPRPFSVKQALLGVPKSADEKIRAAFRYAVHHQAEVIAFSFGKERVCPVMGTPLRLGTQKLYVNHKIPLDNLIDAFCREETKTVLHYEVEEAVVGDRREWHLKEPALDRWQKFHWKNAKLQIVSLEGLLELDRRQRLAERFGLAGLST